KANFNTIFFQVRGRTDAMYQSQYEPWSQQLTGTLGKDPGWDPLAFVIQEAHAHAMELHAWFNTNLAKYGNGQALNSIPQHHSLHPEWLHLVDGEWWIDPGIPAARNYLVKVAMDIVRKYDIDGIHFDFIRYPAKPFPDDATYKRYGGSLARADWRRENINAFVRAFHDSVVIVKPMLKIGSSPIGIYTNIDGARGLQSYSDLYQDSRRWLREGTQDYLVPQTYWSLGEQRGEPDFAAIARDWALNSFGRHIYLGIGAYKPEVLTQLPALIDTTRKIGAHGNSFFRFENISRVLQMGGRYRFPANIPPMPWKDSIPPNPPTNVKVTGVASGVFKIEWKSPRPAVDGDGAKCYDIYRLTTKPINMISAANLIAITTSVTKEFLDTIGLATAPTYFYAVSSLDRGNNESLPAVESVIIPEVVELSKQLIPRNRLGHHYPEPASGVVFIPYEVRESAPVRVSILDVSNREVITLVDSIQESGRHIAAAPVSKLRSGAYSYEMIVGNFSARRSFTIKN
ncbi:MAG: family 10 glycosylhydrolase, partial [Ignavibacteriales bacterium]|nr:family 10 glycosylhydrolase [Ignavibacteriales bacterium]